MFGFEMEEYKKGERLHLSRAHSRNHYREGKIIERKREIATEQKRTESQSHLKKILCLQHKYTYN